MRAADGTFEKEPPPARGRDAGVAGLVALLAAALALPFLAGISMLDEGALVHIADRIASGEVLYRDVATGVMPGAYYLHALLFVLFGRSLLVGRIFMILLFALASATVFLLARRVSSRPVALAASVSFSAVSVPYWRFPGYSPEAMLLVLWTLTAALAYAETRLSKWLVLTGLGLGAAILFKQNYGAFAALGVAAGLAAAAPDVRRAFRDVALAAVVAAAPLALVAALFAVAGASTEFWASTVGIPLRGAKVFVRPWPPLLGELDPRIVRDVVYCLPFEELAIDAQSWLFRHRWLPLLIVRLSYNLPPLFLVAAAGLWWRRRARLRRSASPPAVETTRLGTGALLLGTAAFLFLGVFPRVDAHHLVMALAPSFPLAAWLVGPATPRSIRRLSFALAGGLLAVSLASQAAAVYAAHPEERRDAFLAHPRARVWVERWQAAQIEDQLEELERRVPRGEPIFVAPSSPMYYFLADRPNPTRYPLVLPGALDEEEVVRALSASPVRYALLSDIAFEHFPFAYVAPTVWSYVERNFVPAEGAEWAQAPFAPYLYERGRAPRAAPTEREALDLVEPPFSPPPPLQTVSSDEWSNEDPYRVEWQTTYLEPSLVVRAPGGWRKAFVSWEVPVGEGYRFELDVALTPWAWAGFVEGQGALVELWVSASTTSASPQRVFLKWLNPRDVVEDRRWHHAAVDLAALVPTPTAVVTLVSGPGPTFVEADATVAFRRLRLFAPAAPPPPAARSVLLDEAAARRLLAFQPEDLALFEEAARRYPDLGAAQIALAEVAASLGRHDVALAAAERAVRVDPEPAHPWMRLGQERQHAGRLDAAIEAMEAALERDPTNANYHAALAAVGLDAQDWARARVGALAALRHDPDNVWALTILARAEERSGHLAAALEAAERSVALAPDAAWARLSLAAILIALDRTDEALSALDDAGRLSMDAGARAELARNLLACGRVERARDEAALVLAEEPASLGGLLVLGHSEAALGQWERAVAAWRDVVRLDPASSSALVQLARALARVGEDGEARDALDAARARAGNDPARVREVALVLDELGAHGEASALWRRVAALAPEGPMKDEARQRIARSSP